MKKAVSWPVLSLMVILMTSLISSSVGAQPHFGVQGSFGEKSDFGIGARLVVDLGYAKGLGFTGAFDYFFPDIVDYFEVNGNVTYTFTLPNSNLAPYAGGGLTLGHASVGWLGASNNEVMPSLLGGFKLINARGMNPFLELRIELSGYEQFVITGGVLF